MVDVEPLPRVAAPDYSSRSSSLQTDLLGLTLELVAAALESGAAPGSGCGAVAGQWRCLDLDTPVAFPDNETRLVVR